MGPMETFQKHLLVGKTRCENFKCMYNGELIAQPYVYRSVCLTTQKIHTSTFTKQPQKIKHYFSKGFIVHMKQCF